MLLLGTASEKDLVSGDGSKVARQSLMKDSTSRIRRMVSECSRGRAEANIKEDS